MPIKKCIIDGQSGYKWGDQGKCYIGPNAKQKALAQALAIGGGQMPSFKGFEDWVEIFTGGRQKDSLGREWDGDQLIDKAIKSFNKSQHEPPIVVGHPAENAPAYGWVDGVREGIKNGRRVLEAKFKQVVPEFASAVEQGLYKKRSASFYPDGSLRHVGFLGASPPAVKGLADIAFNDGSGTPIEFEDVLPAAQPGKEFDNNMDVKSFIEALKALGDKDVLELLGRGAGDKNDPATATKAQFSEPQKIDYDLLAQKMFDLMKDGKLPGDTGKDQNQDGGEPAKPEPGTPAFSEQKLREEMAQREAAFNEQLQKIQADARAKELEYLVKDKVKGGVIPPAFMEHGLMDFVQAIDNPQTEIQFSEGAQIKKMNPVDMFIGFFEMGKNAGMFSEYTSIDKVDPDVIAQEEDWGDKIAQSAQYRGMEYVGKDKAGGGNK